MGFNIYDILIISGMFLSLVVIMTTVPVYLFKRAAVQVVTIFRGQEALDEDSAKNIDELGLRPPSFVERTMKTRDYKPYALNVLFQLGAIRDTPEGLLFLSEEALREICSTDPNDRLGLRAIVVPATEEVRLDDYDV